MVYQINKKNLELLVNLANNPRGVAMKELINRGFEKPVDYLCAKGYAQQIKIQLDLIAIESIKQKGTYSVCKITEEGNTLVNKALKYVNDSL